MTPTVKHLTETLKAAGLMSFSFNSSKLGRHGVTMDQNSKVRLVTYEQRGTTCILRVASGSEETNLAVVEALTKVGVCPCSNWASRWFCGSLIVSLTSSMAEAPSPDLAAL